MTTFTTVLRHDLHALRWLLPVWVLTLAASKFSTFHWLIGEEASRLPHAPIYLSFLSLATAVTWFLVLGHLAFNHAPADHRAAWRPRPLRGSVVGAEKVLIGVLLLVVLPAVVSATWDSQGQLLDLKEILRGASVSGIVLLVMYCGFFFVASLCRSSRRFLLTLPFLFAGMMIAQIALKLVAERQLLNPPSSWGAAGAGLTFAIGLLLLIIRQYRRPQTALHIIASVGVFLLTGLVTQLPLRQ